MATEELKEEYGCLLEEIGQYKEWIDQQKDHLLSLDGEIVQTEDRIQEKMTVPGGLVKLQGKHKRHTKYIRILENKLNQETVKFDSLLSSNMDYRKDIAHLLQQKGIGFGKEKKFLRQLAAQKNITEELEGKCAMALNNRSDAETRMVETKECIEGETVVFKRRQKQLKTIILRDGKLSSFLGTKLQEKTPLENDVDSKKRKKQQQYQHEVQKLDMYIQGHKRLVEVTREEDLCQIGLMFIKNEQKNFAHIDYINELQSKKNMMRNCTDKLKREILCLEGEDKGHQETSKSQFDDLESELEKCTSLADSLAKQCTGVQQTLDQLKTAINDLSSEALAQRVTITFDNIEHFTSLLEETVSNLLIQANSAEDLEEMELPYESLLLANSSLLPESEAVTETERGRTPSRSIKSV